MESIENCQGGLAHELTTVLIITQELGRAGVGRGGREREELTAR